MGVGFSYPLNAYACVFAMSNTVLREAEPQNHPRLVFMRSAKPFPLYPTYLELKDLNLSNYPDLQSFLESGQSWRRQH